MPPKKDNLKSPEPTATAKKGLSDKPTAAQTTTKTVRIEDPREQEVEEVEQVEMQGPPVSRLITDLLRTIAIEESDVSF